MKRLLIILTVCLAINYTPAESYDGLTRYNMRQEIRRMIADNPKDYQGNADAGRQRWTDDELNRRIEIVQTEIVRRTRCLQAIQYFATYVSTPSYTLPDDVLLVERVAIRDGLVNKSTYYKLIVRYSWYGLDEMNEGWQGFANSRPERYALWGNEIYLNPPCSSAYQGSNYLMIQYTVNPSSFTSDDSKPFNNNKTLYPYHDAIIYRVAEMCKIDERLFAEATYFNQRYEMVIAMIDKFVEPTSQPDYKPSFHGGQ